MVNRGTVTAILCVCSVMVTVAAAGGGRRAEASSPAATPSAASTPAICPVTLPNGSTPPGEQPMPSSDHGNGAVWTELWPGGIVLVTPDDVQPDGSLAMKVPWWRGPNVHGPLTITGRRLDAPAPPLRARVPEGYGDTGFQSTALFFPSDGCWEVTGRAGGAGLAFVTLVVRSPVLAIPASSATPAA